MADTHDVQDSKNFYLDVPACSAFQFKGSNSLDWCKNRLARVYSPYDCRTAMLAVDHGYFQGDETPEETLDLNHSFKSMEEKGQYAK